MYTVKQSPNAAPSREKKVRWPQVIVLLIFFVSSFMAGMVVGRSNEDRTIKGGTIFLSPTVGTALPINVFGRVVDPTGATCQGMRVEWHSEPRYTTTDEQGNFMFDNVELGAHTVTVLNDTGKAVGKTQINISRDIMLDSMTLQKNGGGRYELVLSAQVIDIDLMVILDEGEERLELLADPSYSWTNLQNKALEPEMGGRTELGGGRFEGKVFQEAFRPNQDSGNLDKPNNGGTGTKPKTDTPRPSASVPPQAPKESDVPAETPPISPVPTPTLTPTPAPSASTTPTPSPLPTDPPKETPSPSKKPDEGGGNQISDISISSQDGEEKKQWSADTRIDLFGKNTKLQPGSYGGYQFDVKNPNYFGVKFQIWMVDSAGTNPDETPIPLRYRLKCGDEYVAGDEDTWLDSTEIKANWVTLEQQKTLTYTLEWCWPYELGTDGDQTDTHLGETHDQPHLIKICTYFEQVEGG